MNVAALVMQQGFALLPEVIPSAEIAHVAEHLRGASRSRAGAGHLMKDAIVATLARDSRLLAIAKQMLGEAATPFRATLFDKNPESNWLVVWHQDTALPLENKNERSGWGPWSVKEGVHYAHAPAAALQRILALRLHLDEQTHSNGPLRVIAGSHDAGVLSDAEVERIAATASVHTCVAPRGSILVMRPLVIHSSSKAIGEQPRRVLHIEYAESLDVAPGMRLAIA